MRHKTDHLPATLVKAAEAADVRHAIDVYAQLRAINGATISILREAREAGDGDLALKAVDRVQRQIELQAKLIGELDSRPEINITITAEWVAVRAVIVAALGPHPDARQAVVDALAAWA